MQHITPNAPTLEQSLHLQRLVMKEDPAFTMQWPQTFQCRIEVRGKSGRQWSAHLKNPKGHPGKFMSDREIEDKFLRLTLPILGPERSRAVLDMLWAPEKIQDVSQICDALVN